jgi:UDP-N-acetyl-D-mannosaminuronic acid dehydrogenase
VKHDIVVVGGFGHVGLPLALAFAHKGKTVCALDINEQARQLIASGVMPFYEEGAEPILRDVLAAGRLTLTLDPAYLAEAETVIIIIGTPVDEHLNPDLRAMRHIFDEYRAQFRDGQLVILRSTVFPGMTEKVGRWFEEMGKKVDVAFCPERIAEGLAVKELEELPQIVSGLTPQAEKRASELFRNLTADIITVKPVEAELTKLFNNVWRYIKFSVANQFYMIANDHDVDFYRIHHAMTHKYPRGRDFPRPGFAAGPCLFKDTMQLAAFNNNTFFLGHSAMLVNEGLPNYIVNRLRRRIDLHTHSVGILGMAFKAGSDDKRESLSYKLKKIFAFESQKVFCSDVFINDPGFISPEELIDKSDVIVLGTPHREYADLELPADKIIVDVWNFWGKGSVV